MANRQTGRTLGLVAGISVVFAVLGAAHAQSDGVSALSTVVVRKAENAGQDAENAAERQRALVEQQQRLREEQRRREALRNGVRVELIQPPLQACPNCLPAPAEEGESDDDPK